MGKTIVKKRVSTKLNEVAMGFQNKNTFSFILTTITSKKIYKNSNNGIN